jgi:hypothetical protein
VANDHLLALRSVIGETLVDCVSTQHISREGKAADLDLYLRFESSGWIQLRGAADGRAIQSTLGTEPETFDMGESGHVTPQRAESSDPRSRFVGRQLTRLEPILMPNSADPIGVELVFGRQLVLVYNWGDTLLTATSMPEYLIKAGARIG